MQKRIVFRDETQTASAFVFSFTRKLFSSLFVSVASIPIPFLQFLQLMESWGAWKKGATIMGEEILVAREQLDT
jgi:hypothetical protein